MGAESATEELSLSEAQMQQLRLLLACEAVHGGACVTLLGPTRRLSLGEGDGLDAAVLVELIADELVGSVSRERGGKPVTVYWLTRKGWRVARGRADHVAQGEPSNLCGMVAS